MSTSSQTPGSEQAPEPLTRRRLAEIRERVADARYGAAALIDVPALLAEVERLRLALRSACDDIAVLDDEIGAQSARVAELERAAVDGRAALADLISDHEDPGTAALGALHLLARATVGVTAPRDQAAEVLARHDAGLLEKAADRLEESDHLHAADELRDMAAEAWNGGAR